MKNGKYKVYVRKRNNVSPILNKIHVFVLIYTTVFVFVFDVYIYQCIYTTIKVANTMKIVKIYRKY